MGLRLLTPPASAGVQWMREGLRDFWRQPLGFASLFVTFMLVAQLLGLVPLLGAPLALAGVPLLSLAYMMAGHRVSLGGLAQPQVFLAPWQSPALTRQRLITLCLLYAGLCLLCLRALDWLDGGEFVRQMDHLAEASARPDGLPPDMLTNGTAAEGMLLRVAATTLLGLPFWHAPALVLWAGQSVAQALFSSTIALWRAKAAFLTFGVAWLGAMLAASVLLSVMGAVISGTFAVLLMVPLGLMLIGAFQTSMYPTYRDCFGAPEAH